MHSQKQIQSGFAQNVIMEDNRTNSAESEPAVDRPKSNRKKVPIYQNSLLNITKIRRIPTPNTKFAESYTDVDHRSDVSQASSSSMTVEDQDNYSQPNQEWTDKIDRDVGENKFFNFILKQTSDNLIGTEPNFDKMPAEEVIRILQKEQRLSYTSSKSQLPEKYSSRDSQGSQLSRSKPKQKSRVHKIEIPWRGLSQFSSPTAQRNKIFQNFHKMSPEPPRTPTPPVKAILSKSFTAASRKMLLPPRPRSLSQKARSVPQKKLEPSKLYQQSQSQPKSTLKQQQKSKSRKHEFTTTRLEGQTVVSDGFSVEANASRMVRLGSSIPSKTKTKLLKVKTMPSTNLSAVQLLDSPEFSRSLQDGIKLTELIPESRQIENLEKSQTAVQMMMEAEAHALTQTFVHNDDPAERLRPSRLVPLHIPGPRFDNIFIGSYESGSDTSDSDNEISKEQDSHLEQD